MRKVFRKNMHGVHLMNKLTEKQIINSLNLLKEYYPPPMAFDIDEFSDKSKYAIRRLMSSGYIKNVKSVRCGFERLAGNYGIITSKGMDKANEK